MRLIHRLILKRYGISRSSALNIELDPPVEAVDPPAFNRHFVAMKTNAFNLATGRVDYAQLRDSAAYADFRECAAGLREFDPTYLTDEHERLAFWINLYNALIIDAVIQFDIQRSVQELPGFFWRAAYEVGGMRFGSFDIEYGILRANRGHPAIPGPHFGSGDPRLTFTLDQPDPRIHFALVCAARSCPPIAIYDADQIDSQLELAAQAFIQGSVRIDREKGEVQLSRIFQWYAPDFGARPMGLGDKTPLLRYIARYMTDEPSRDFLLGSRPRVHFTRYNWSLNQ
jgi:hypothetical protein